MSPTNLKQFLKHGSAILSLLIASSTFSVAAPNPVMQNTTIELKSSNLSIEELFKEIEKQTNYLVIYSTSEINSNFNVSLSNTKAKISEILEETLKPKNLKYEISNNYIILSKVEESTETKEDTQQDIKIISGTIKDEHGDPIIGANVMEKGSANNGTITDVNGVFKLSVTENATLIISYIGYKDQQINVGNQSNINIILKEDSETLSEIVVVGYGTQKRVNLTGAVSQVTSKVMKDRQVSNVGQALQGTIGNLEITTTGDPGGLGTPSKFNIRGITSINGGSPLFVVDGIPNNSIDNLNPADIASVTVLKDAASAAIYGARAAYGVILIETKKGSVQKTTVSYSGMVAISQPTKFPRQVNSLLFAETMNQSAKNSGVANIFTEEHIARIKQYMEDPNSIPVTLPNPADPNEWGYENANANTDWADEFLKSNAFSHKHDLSINGGNKKVNYFTSLGYYDQNGILRYGDESYKRINVTSNLHAEPLEWLRFDLRMRYSRSNIDNPYPYSANNGNWFHFIATRQPNWPARNPDGQFSMISNINTFFNGARDKNTTNDFWITGAMEIEPVKDWKINADYSFNSLHSNALSQENPIYAYKVDGTRYPYYTSTSISENAVMNTYNSFNIYTSYQKQLKKHYFKVLLGQQIELAQYYTLSGSRKELISAIHGSGNRHSNCFRCKAGMGYSWYFHETELQF